MRTAFRAGLRELGDRSRGGVESGVAYCHRCAAALLGHKVEKPGPFEVL